MGFLTPPVCGKENWRPTALQFRVYERNVRRASMRKTRTIRRLQRVLRLRRAAEREQREAVISQSRLAETQQLPI